MPKVSERLKICAVILATIIFADRNITISHYSLNVAFLFLLIFGYFASTKLPKKSKIYLVITSLILTIGYVSFHLFELFDPIWVVFDRKWMLSLAIVYFVLMLTKTTKLRVLTAIIGSGQGEILYSVILQKFNFQDEIGSFHYLDVLSLSLFFLFVWTLIENAAFYFDQYAEKVSSERQVRK
jgi:hypothetical protein